MLTIIKQVSIFVICAQMILHFKAEQKYGKYLKLLIGVMVLVQLFVPLMSLFGQGEEIFVKNMTYYVSGLAGNTESTNIPGEEDFTELQMQEIKSIFNNMQAETEEGTMKEEGGEEVYSPDNTSEKPIGEGRMFQTEESESEIIIERIEVKPDDG